MNFQPPPQMGQEWSLFVEDMGDTRFLVESSGCDFVIAMCEIEDVTHRVIVPRRAFDSPSARLMDIRFVDVCNNQIGLA
jgi:hypothetical protein